MPRPVDYVVPPHLVPDPNELIGGISALALWADQNPGEFFGLMIDRGLLSDDDWSHAIALLPQERRNQLVDYALSVGAATGVQQLDGSWVYTIQIGKRKRKRRTREQMQKEAAMKKLLASIGPYPTLPFVPRVPRVRRIVSYLRVVK